MSNKQRNLKRRYNVYRRALERLGVELPELSRPNARSLENARREWRKAKYYLQSIGIDPGSVDEWAKREKVPPIGSDNWEALQKIARIKGILNEGLSYVSSKYSQAGAIMVNQSALRIKEIIDEAIRKYGAEETCSRLEEWAGERDIVELVERIVYGVYDPEYSKWAKGRDAYERIISEMADALEVTDIMGELFS